MNIVNRFIYFFCGVTLGVIAVIFIGKKKNIQFPYGPDARTLKSIRIKKHYIFSDQAKQAMAEHQIDSIKLAYLLTKSDVNFSESDTDIKKPCQTYKIYGELKDKEVSLIIKRCDSTATFEEILINK